ncbi:hypothetical protein T492DRAFT_1025926 [Pavlovales sp. CCMP2436]|nr:hypothetical protein T492DRAFT_1025926 [Pavlovales sp. CCMP2436]|mmetsp:Transcript_35724/g.82742  ORF Transcript_35724/g.82742 Transcript_35724/m.82742 type:complete len:178 (+) Transcript_35724:6-539(+)
MAIFVLAICAVGLVSRGPSVSTRSQVSISRRGLLAATAVPLFAFPLASLAAPYLPPGSETDDFKSLDKSATDFKRRQIQYKATWAELTDKLLAAKSDDESIEVIGAMQKAFLEGGGSLPEGVSRDTFLRSVRRKQKAMEAIGMNEKPVRMSVLALKSTIDVSRKMKGMNDVGQGPVF